MFSRKVLCAVDIIRILNDARYRERGLKLGEIVVKGVMDSFIYKAVLSELSRHCFIQRKGSAFILVKQIESITLYDLNLVFHQGVVMGEPISLKEFRGVLPFDPRYSNIMNAEQSLEDLVNKLMKTMRLSELLPRQGATGVNAGVDAGIF